MQVDESAVCEWCHRLPLAFALKEDILSTCCNKEDVMWHVWLSEIQYLPIVFVAFQSFLSRRVRYSVWNHCCKWPNYNLCISQGSVPTALKWGGQTYSHLRRVFDVGCQKLLKLANVSRNYSKNKSGTFLWTTVYVNTNCKTPIIYTILKIKMLVYSKTLVSLYTQTLNQTTFVVG